MAHIVQQAFGRDDVNLYDDVLKVPRDCNLAQLRKAYYKQALLFHPDKNDSDSAKLKFQAISWTYQFLIDPEKRAGYDEDGTLPGEDDETNDDEGKTQWKEYFDKIFGKVSASKIDEFSLQYKMSEDEEKDVLASYEKFRGDFTKMLEYVMLSEESDLARWMEDYIKPAIRSGKAKDYLKASNEALDRLMANRKQCHQASDSDRTETESSDDDQQKQQSKVLKKKKSMETKAKLSQPKNATGDKNMDLVAAIRNRHKRGNAFAALGARYGVSMEDNDPLDDETFARLQKKYKKT